MVDDPHKQTVHQFFIDNQCLQNLYILEYETLCLNMRDTLLLNLYALGLYLSSRDIWVYHTRVRLMLMFWWMLFVNFLLDIGVVVSETSGSLWNYLGSRWIIQLQRICILLENGDDFLFTLHKVTINIDGETGVILLVDRCYDVTESLYGLKLLKVKFFCLNALHISV